jgi:nucleotide-binding universal stress UspA family protein
MINLQRILLPTDFSEYSAAATSYACEFTDRFDADLHVVHILQLLPTTTPTFAGGLAWNKFMHESRDAAAESLATLLPDEWVQRHRVFTTVLAGTPFLEIVRYAKDNDIDMIVMGTHGHSGLAHMLMGSVAERVVRKAPCPVLTVRPEGHQFVMP